MCVTLTICSSCKLSPIRARDDAGRTGGELLANAVQQAIESRRSAVELVRHECLWACKDSCTVLIESEERTGYLTGRFDPTEDAAEALLDWAQVYGQSLDGSVPFKQWPPGMKGHFIARLPKRERQTP